MLISLCTDYVKVFSIIICINFIIFKMNKYKINVNKNVLLGILLSMIISIIYVFMYQIILQKQILTFTSLLFYILYSFIFIYFMRISFLNGIMLTTVSMTMILISRLLGCIINFPFIKLNIYNNEVVEFIGLGIIQFTLLILFFKIKRFKDGISFLKDSENYKKSDTIGWIISILVIFSCFLICVIEEYNVKSIIIFIIGLGGLLMVTWIRKNITKHYKQKMKDRTVEIQAEKIKEKDREIMDLKEELNKALKINHKYNHRISAIEKAITKLKFNEEFAKENCEIIEFVNRLSKEYKEEVFKLNKNIKLNKTKVISVDTILEYMYNKASKNNISFNVEIKCDIKKLIEEKIKENKLETLLADLIDDAIIATSFNNNSNKKIFVVFDKIDNIFEIKIYDTGVEFEIETLLKLGLEQITTHKATGGSGIGYITTFETLKECKASLTINELNSNDYTKFIKISFDDKFKYKIYSYRAEEIIKQNNSNRIIDIK